jgi:transcriptional regulator with XRE-family HTH domain
MKNKQLRKPSNKLTKLLAKNIRKLRYDNNLSQEKLAELCGLHRTYVGSVERGERNVTLSSLEAFASAFKVKVIDLLKE